MKWMFLWRPTTQPSLETLRSALGPILPVTVHLTSIATPRVSVVPFRRAPLALVTISGNEERMLQARSRLGALPGSLAGYRVDESIPRSDANPRVRDGLRDGVALVTLFRQNPHRTRDQFFREWFGRHTPLSLRIHPMIEYVRNVVTEAVVEGSPPCDGIVTEQFARREDLVHPWRLFGGAFAMLANMAIVGLHVAYFLDLPTLETYLMQEWRLE